MLTYQQRRAITRPMEITLSGVAGRAVGLTVRDGTNFTASFEEVDEAAARKLCAFLKAGGAHIEDAHHDDECGTFIYFDAQPGKA